MNLEEKIAEIKESLAEKRAELKKKAKEARDSTSDMGNMQACVDACKQLQKDIEQLNKDLVACQEACGLDPDGDGDASGDNDGDGDGASEGNPPAQTNSADPAASTSKPTVIKGEAQTNSLHLVGSQKPVIRSIETIPGYKNIQAADRRNSPQARAFEQYIRSKGEIRDAGIMSSDPLYGAIVPTEYLKPSLQPLPPNSLAPLVNKVPVKYRTGHWPIFKRQTVGMTPVTQLAQNNTTANPALIDAVYDIQTYRQQLNIGQEMIDDTDYDVTGYVSDFLMEQKYLTEQYAIGKLLAVGDANYPVVPTTVRNVDDIKHQNNAVLNIAYANRYFVATQSAFDVLDQVKTATGKPLLGESLKDATQRTLFGYPLLVVQDVAMGVAGDKFLWLGDPKAYVFYAYRLDMSARWFFGGNYENQMYVFYRADFKVGDYEGGISMKLADDFLTQYELAQAPVTTTTTTA